MTASASAGALAGKRPSESPTAYSIGVSLRSNSTCHVSFSPPGSLSRAPAEEDRLDGVFATIAERAEVGGLVRRGSAVGHGGRRPGAGPELRVEALQHPERLLAAGLAEVQTRFALEEDGVGVVGAVVAALAAILLRHRRHELLRLRPGLGHLHALGDRQRRVVPGRVVVVGELLPAAGHLGRADRGGALHRRTEKGGEVARQPRALVGGERSVLGNEDDGGRDVLAHAAALRAGCSSARSRRASGPVRAVKVWKLSSGPVRRAR